MMYSMQAGYTAPPLPQAAGIGSKKPATEATTAAAMLKAGSADDAPPSLRAAGAAAAKRTQGQTSRAEMTKRAAAVASSGSSAGSEETVTMSRGSERARLLPADAGAGGVLSRKDRRALKRCGPAQAIFVEGVLLAAQLMPVACAHLTDPGS